MFTRKDMIVNYLSGVDFNADEWTVEDIKNNIRKLIHETPAIKISYVKDVVINEMNRESKEINKLNTISITYTDESGGITSVEFDPSV